MAGRKLSGTLFNWFSVSAVIGLSLSIGGGSVSAGQPQSSLPPKLKLVLVISVDQMRFDYLTRFDDLYQGGFRTLLDRGAVFTHAFYHHANTRTGPGHAVILTGSHPSHSGIAANKWFDRHLGRLVNDVEDPYVTIVGGSGVGASPRNLLTPTVGDALKKAQPQAKVVSLAITNRAAILLGGLTANAAYWFNKQNCSFVTSSYYMKNLPPWIEDLNRDFQGDALAAKQWTRLLPDEDLYLQRARADDFPQEASNLTSPTFPHLIASCEDVVRSPLGDQFTVTMAKHAVENYRLGTDDVPDLLALSFSAPDEIGHAYGPWSQEAMDEFLRLDGVLGELLAWLEKRVGRDHLLVVLTSDHGVTPIPEFLAQQGEEARRIKQADLEKGVREGLQGRVPSAAGILQHIEEEGFYLNLNRVAAVGLTRAQAEELLRTLIERQDGVEAAYTRTQMLGDQADKDEFLYLYQNGYYEGRSPDLVVRFKPHYYLSKRSGGTGHGTPHEYDRHVPILFMGPMIRKGIYEKQASPEDIAPTLAWILGLDFPKEDDSRVLLEMLDGKAMPQVSETGRDSR